MMKLTYLMHSTVEWMTNTERFLTKGSTIPITQQPLGSLPPERVILTESEAGPTKGTYKLMYKERKPSIILLSIEFNIQGYLTYKRL